MMVQVTISSWQFVSWVMQMAVGSWTLSVVNLSWQVAHLRRALNYNYLFYRYIVPLEQRGFNLKASFNYIQRFSTTFN